MYNPGTGRFLQRDPLGYMGSWISSDGLNIYQYVAGQVTVAVDPMGLERLIFAFEGLAGTKDELFPKLSSALMGEWVNGFLSADNNETHYFSQEQNGNVVAIVKKHIDNPKKNAQGQCVYPGIAIFGYSQGGRAAIQATEDLSWLNIEVDLGFTVDPVPKGLELLPPFIFAPGLFLNKPDSSRVWYNFYQKVDTGTLAGMPLRGHPVGGASNVDVSSDLAGKEKWAHVAIMGSGIPLGPRTIAQIVVKDVPKEKADWRAKK